MVRALVDTLARHFPLDRTRVGLVGFSDAGTLAYEIACAAPRTITAIGVISGEVPSSACAPAPPLSAMVFHGTADRNIPFRHTAQDVAGWASREQCRFATRDSIAPLVRDVFDSCGGTNAQVVLYTIVGGKHGWPGGKRSCPETAT